VKRIFGIQTGLFASGTQDAEAMETVLAHVETLRIELNNLMRMLGFPASAITDHPTPPAHGALDAGRAMREQAEEGGRTAEPTVRIRGMI